MSGLGSEIRVVITITKKTGKVTAEVEGVTGSACTQYTQPVMNIGEVLVDKKTPDFYQSVMQDVEQDLSI